jgi:hypothetical protein
MAKWVSFRLDERRAGAKTDVWFVFSLTAFPAHLGVVKWYAQWRKYAFFPASTALFEQDCLRDIAEFLESETEKHRKGKRAFPPEVPA